MFGKKRWGKKGSIEDLLYIAVSLVVISIVLIIAYKITNGFYTGVTNSPMIQKMEAQSNSTYATSSIKTINGDYKRVLDKAFLFITMMACLIALVMAALVRVHPVFFIFYILFLVFIIFLTAIFSNAYQEIAAQPGFTTLADDLYFTSKIMGMLPFIVGIFGILLSIVMYKTSQSQSGGGGETF
jgi:hypothetical protein